MCDFVTSCLQELISSPLGSKHSQTDSQSESSQNNDQDEPGQSTCTTSASTSPLGTMCNGVAVLCSGSVMPADPSSAFQEESQVLNICPPPNKKK